MRLDLQRDYAEISAHLAARVHAFNPETNYGPGDPGLIKMIEVGFEYAQAGWVLVVFDTRADASPDGEWTMYIEDNDAVLERSHWLEAGEVNIDQEITLVQLDGSEIIVPPGTELAEPLGELLKTILVKAREDGLFAPLPKAAECEVGVEHLSGAYGWPIYEERGQENLV